jgi:hypothetical protein
LVVLVLIAATDQIVPATSDRQAQLRIWLAARATGIVAFVLLTAQVALPAVPRTIVTRGTSPAHATTGASGGAS